MALNQAKLLAHLKAKSDHPNLLVHSVLAGLTSAIERGDFADDFTPDAEVLTHTYRIYNPFGDLLCVGISLDWKMRLKQHRKSSAWFRMAARCTVETYASSPQAFAAESWAITYEHPEWNSDNQRKDCPFIPPIPLACITQEVIHDTWSND